MDAKTDQAEKLAALLDDLGPEGRQLFEEAMDLSNQKKRVMLTGYALALGSILFGLPLAFYLFGRDTAAQSHWMFFVPFALAGFFMMSFSKRAKRLGQTDSQDEQ
jgi:hypothetical protein